MSRKYNTGGRRSRTPSAERSSTLDAVTRLMEERTRYEEWLDELEEKKDSTPPKVFERVRKDYLSRLQTVMDQLKEHTTLLQEHAANLVAKLRELEGSEQEITDELAESELRAQVGEITEAEWEATSRKAQREVAKLKENQEAIADDLIKIRDILSDGGDEEEEEDEIPRTSADFDELEFLKSVVGPASGTPVSNPRIDKKVPPPPRPTTPPSAPAQSVYPTPRKSGDSPRATPSDPVAATSAKPAESRKPAAPASSGNQPSSGEAPDNALGLRSEEVPEQPKTLKCAECGTMNYPSEWYCEQCGAELAQI